MYVYTNGNRRRIKAGRFDSLIGLQSCQGEVCSELSSESAYHLVLLTNPGSDSFSFDRQNPGETLAYTSQ